MNKVAGRILLVLLVILATVAVDQVSKKIARDNLRSRGAVFVLGDVFILRYIENEGAFLGMGASFPAPVKTAVFIAFPLLMLVGLLVFIVRSREVNLALTLGLSLITAGGAGNLIDRILWHGRVSDFMNLGIGNLRTGIFNVADLAIVVGFSLIIVVELASKKRAGPGPGVGDKIDNK